MKIFLFIIFIFFLQGCGIKVDVGSSAIVQDGVQAPSLLTLVTPTSNVSFVDTPMVTVSGVTIGDTITVYSDNCLTSIGTQVAVATSVNITTSILPEGIYSLRANATRDGVVSSCSTSSLSYTVDTTAPTVTSISPIPLDDTYLTNPGENLEFTVNFSKNVTVTGVPALTLELDGINNRRRAVYVSGTTTNELLFRYTTVPSDFDTNGIALNSNWDFEFGSLANAASVPVSTSLPVPMIPNLSGVLINQSPYILSVTIDPRTYTYNENLDFTVVYSEIVTIDFIPVVVEGVGPGGLGVGVEVGGSILRFELGGETVNADYLSGSGTTTLVYRWTNVTGLTDNDGITLISPIRLNGVTLWDSVKNDAILSFTVPDLSGVLVDGTLPTLPPVGVNYYGSTNFTFMPGAESAALYPAIDSGDAPTSYTSGTIINNNIFNTTTGVFSVLTWAGFSSFFTNTSTVIRASNSAGFEDVTLSFTASPIINKGQISQGFQHTCAIASGGVFCWGKQTAWGGGWASDLYPSPFPIGSGIRLIGANKGQTCAVDHSTHLQCWANSGMATPARYAVITSSDGEAVDQITDLSMGGDHTCYLRLGKAYCFGSNNSGQLGNSTNTESAIPQLVDGEHSFNKIVVGASHTCALAGVKVYCWGSNQYGQLGNLTATDSNFPVWGGRLAHQIALGTGFTCALYKGDVFCFGANAKGELGRDTSNLANPAMTSRIDISTYSGISKISINTLGSYVAALSYAGEIYGWGELSKVVLGAGSNLQQIGDISTIASDIVAGSSSVYYLKTDPSLEHTAAWYAFGHANSDGMIGIPGNISGIQQDGLVQGFNPKASFTGLYSGNTATCVHVSSSPHCFGGTDEQITARTEPTFLPLNNIFDETTTGMIDLNHKLIIESVHGASHSCYRFSGGEVICAGSDSTRKGVLGDGSINGVASTGVSVSPAQLSKKLCASQEYTCSLNVLGNVECWGLNRSGRLNTPTMTTADAFFPLPQTIINSQDVVDIACMESRVCFLKEDRKVYCTDGGSLNEVLVPTGKEFVKIKAGSGQFACAQSSDHELFCFGDDNRNTQQGQRLTPNIDLNGTKVIGGVGFPVTGRVLEYGVGARHACATMLLVLDGIRITEDLYCWGDNSQGQVTGIAGGSANQPVKKFSATSSTTEIVAGDRHTCMLDRGSISCWGDAAAQGQDQFNAINGSKNPILPFAYR